MWADLPTMWSNNPKMEKEGSLEWLKDDVGGYIKDRKNFYNSFGEKSEFFNSDELIGKFESLK